MKRYITAKQEICGMSRVGYSGDFEIYVNTDDAGMIPHFHLRNSVDWSKFHTCIEIEHPKYFHHSGKEDVLDSHQRRELQEFMESPVSINKYKTKFDNN